MKSSHTGKPSADQRDLPREQDRGRSAEKPTDVSIQGWLDVLSRTKRQLTEDNLSVVAAGVAFYGFVAVVPAIAVMVAFYGLIANPSQVAEHVTALTDVLPSEVVPLLEEQMVRIASDSTTAGIGAIVGVLIALYSSTNATKALITGMNIAYGEKEKRGFFKLTAVAIGLTLAAIVGVILAVGLVAILPTILGYLNLSGGAATLLNILRWPLVVGGFMAALTVVYRYGPSRDEAKWRWISPGALVAGTLWLIGSALFSLYVSKAGTYGQVYGPLGAVVVFLMWLFLTAFVVLIGAELNSELERQTVKDTTEGKAEPMGNREAHAADTVGPSRENLPEPEKT